MNEEIISRFLSKVNKTSSCWLWIAGTRKGYGVMKVNGKSMGTHRLSYMIHVGEIPDGLFVCHKCDVRNCVNPKHLFLGTHSDNMIDAYNNGRLIVPVGKRFKKGERSFNAILSSEVVLNIKKELKKKKRIPLKQIALDNNTKYQTVRDISAGRAYFDR